MLTAVWPVLLAASAAAETITVHHDQPALDRWMYPFNATPGTRAVGSTFGNFADPDFDNRDAQIVLGFDTADDIPTGLGVEAYDVAAAVVTVMFEGTNDVVYDATIDPVVSYLPESDPRHEPDADPGRPFELFGTGYRNGLTKETFEEASPYGPLFGKGMRNAYAMSWDDTGEAIDVSNNYDLLFDPFIWAVGHADVEPGTLLPDNTDLTFTVNVDDPGIAQYLAEALDCGRLRFTLTSLHTVEVQGGEFPTFYTKENAFVQLGLASAARLDLTVIVDEGEPGEPADLDDDGAVGVPDLLQLLSAWGTCAGETCPEDLDRDGVVGVPDLLELLAAWG